MSFHKRSNYSLFERQLLLLYSSYSKSRKLLSLIVSIFNLKQYYLFADIDIHDISGYTVASRYLKNLEISSAEMTQYMCNLKMAATNCLTKKYRVPFFNNVLRDKIVGKYMNRPQRCDSLTLAQYTR